MIRMWKKGKVRYHASMTAPATDLKNAGLRATRQRIALLTLLRKASKPLAIEELVGQGKGSFDPATAYRMLDSFIGAGLARRIDLAQGRALFEAAGAHHHHAMCVECGRIVDVEACLPKALDERVRSAAGFSQIDDHALEFFGICASCGTS